MTTTADKTLAGVLDEADLNKLADALRKIKLGTMLSAMREASVSQASATTVTLSPPSAGPAGMMVRVTGGTALAGVYAVADSGATPVDSATLGVASLSADGTTLTFAAAVTDIVLSYMPVSAEMDSDFPQSGNG